MESKIYSLTRDKKQLLSLLYTNLDEDQIVEYQNVDNNYQFDYLGKKENVVLIDTKNYNKKISINALKEVLNKASIDSELIDKIVNYMLKADSKALELSSRMYAKLNTADIENINNYFKNNIGLSLSIFRLVLVIDESYKLVAIKTKDRYKLIDILDFVAKVIETNKAQNVLYLGPFILESYQTKNDNNEYYKRFVRLRIEENKLQKIFK